MVPIELYMEKYSVSILKIFCVFPNWDLTVNTQDQDLDFFLTSKPDCLGAPGWFITDK